jgi:Na+/proline symporter
MLLGWGFFPAFFRSGVMTTPIWIEQRFGGKRIRMVLAVVSLVLYCFTKVSATLYAGGIILKTLLGWDIYVSSAALILATGAYTALGGLRVVVYTEVWCAFSGRILHTRRCH